MSLDDYYVENIDPPSPGIDPLTDLPPFDEKVVVRLPKPRIDETASLLSPGVWSIGSLMMCEMVKDGEIPPDAVCAWNDGATYCLRKRSPPRIDRHPEGDFLASRHPEYYGICRGIWNFSPNIFCKAKAWAEGLTTEATTIRWVNKHCPSIPTEEVIYDWIDPEWERTIMISKRVPGEIYDTAWFSLTTQQKLHVAEQVAGHFKTLAENTSDYVETVEGAGLEGIWSLRVRGRIPPWKPRLEPRVSREDHEAYLKRIDDHLGIKSPQPGIGEPYVLQHSDCCPKNFLVIVPSNADEMPKVTGIIDWENIGYLPKWMVAARSRLRQHFQIDTQPITRKTTDWQWMLSNACVQVGFPLEWEYNTELMRKGPLRHYPGLPLEYVIPCDNLPIQVEGNLEDGYKE